ncbi:N-acetyltransferase [Nitratiruptor sp. YY09-18]|uniref:N-acetyltransferase n=1 Tax=Nitratiruptor sp. YY09-18 TaxID=2724901 RepID=UPI001938935B|nr:amino-acid N-acetyltransferase [Nitratiruptor sp. YY09-18]
MAISYHKPKLTDIPAMQALVKEAVQEGIILPRSDDEIATNIRSYIVAKDGRKIVGYVALHIHSMRLGEIRSLIVDEEYRGRRIGQELVKRAVQEGKDLALQEVLSLTYNKPFFEKLGFYEIEKEKIPEQKIWQDCIKCKHFPVCNEVAMMKKIS